MKYLPTMFKVARYASILSSKEMFDKYVYLGGIIAWNAVLIIISFLSLNGRVHFGWGMADIVLVGTILIVLLMVNLIYAFSSKDTSFFFNKRKLIVGIGLVFLLYVCLQMTLLRGPASPWNGNVFF